jgi:hypothetical protein
MATVFTPPYYPIIYVRGYAGNQSEVEDTTADPYMGFNLGSSKLRQLWTGDCARHYFESPIIRLMKDYDYRDVYHAGDVMPAGQTISSRCVVIHRYYERTSRELGDGKRLSVEEAACELATLITTLRDRIVPRSVTARVRDGFRVYLIAHSMGGLVVRSLLQNTGLVHPETGTPVDPVARTLVDKVFTYATPHNGIDLNVIGNVPGFITRNDANNFDRDRMREFLGLPDPKTSGTERVDSLNGRFDVDRFFCLVGTNDKDYDVAGGIVRKAVGPMSDGLVRIDNATVSSPDAEDARVRVNSPRAFVNRSHSGHYGIVNSEEGFQNLTRFLFGDVRVDGSLHVKTLWLPPQVQAEKDKGREVRASYHFEVVARVRGAIWDLHRRTTAENSAIFRQYDDLMGHGGKPVRDPHLFSAFLSRRARVNAKRPTLGFSLDLRVLVPQYEVNRKLWFDEHYEGGFLYRDKINLLATPPTGAGKAWSLAYGYDSETPNQTKYEATATRDGDRTRFELPVRQNTRPGIDAVLTLEARPWNE